MTGHFRPTVADARDRKSCVILESNAEPCLARFGCFQTVGDRVPLFVQDPCSGQPRFAQHYREAHVQYGGVPRPALSLRAWKAPAPILRAE